MSQASTPRQFYFESGGVIQGPVLARDLKALAVSGNLQPSDIVWELDTGRRFPASTIGGLFSHVPVTQVMESRPKNTSLATGSHDARSNARGNSRGENHRLAASTPAAPVGTAASAAPPSVTIVDAVIVEEKTPASSTSGVAPTGASSSAEATVSTALPAPQNALLPMRQRDVFISYSSKEKTIADAICGVMERQEIRCWIAPRDIRPGQNYAESILEAINNCRMMVIILSSASNASPHVLREVERGVSKGLPVVPFRIEDIKPSKSLEFFLSAPHWLDALTPPLDGHIQRLAEVVRTILENKAETSESEAGGLTRFAYRNRPRNRGLFRYLGIAGTVFAVLSLLGLLISWSIPNSLQGELAEYQRNLDIGNGSIVFLSQHATSRFPQWLKEAERGNPIGQLFVGRCYQEGLVVAPDSKVATEWLKRAADNGNSFAQLALGFGYSDGTVGERNLPESLRWNTLAAEQGNSSAMRNLGFLYAEGIQGKPELEKAFEWFRRAAEAGNTAAMRKLGDCYRQGHGVDKNDVEADKWYARALATGDVWLKGKQLGEEFATHFAAQLDPKSSTARKDQAIADLKAKLQEFKTLELNGVMAVFSAPDFYTSIDGLADLPKTTPVREVHDAMVTRLIALYSAASDSEKADHLANFTRAVDIRLEGLQKDKDYAQLAAIWEQCYRRIRYSDLRQGDEWNSLIRQVRCFGTALIKQGKRKEASELIDATTHQCQVWLKERPWDWYLKDAYTGVCFDLADAWFETGDIELIQPLLLQGWTIRLKQFGKEELLSRFEGKLPRKGQVPTGATDAERDFFVRFAKDKTDEKPSKDGQSTASISSAKPAANSKDPPKKSDSGIKRFTIPVDVGGRKYPTHVYVMTGPRGYAELQDQFRWLEEIRGCLVPQDVRDSFRRLNEIAKENNVDFMELAVYALGTATPEQAAANQSPTEQAKKKNP